MSSFNQLYYNFDILLNNADTEILEILNNKKKKLNNNESIINNDTQNDTHNDSQNDNNNLSYDVKKCLAKQKSHELKRQQKSKVFQKKETDNLMNIIYNSNK
tara:strand:+ start:3233 stop:3538 length:306 start_codon:yes stop_codon:yes gene_type:complete